MLIRHDEQIKALEKVVKQHEGYIGADLSHKKEYALKRRKMDAERAKIASENARNRLYSHIPDLIYLLIMLAGGGKYLHWRTKNRKT